MIVLKRVAPLILPVQNLGTYPTGDNMTYEEKFSIIDSLLRNRENLFIDIDYSKFIDALISASNVADYLGVSSSKLRNLVKLVFPEKPNRGRLLNYILALANYKVCKNCNSYLPIASFRANSRNSDGVNSHCKECHSINTAKTQPARQAKYNSAKLHRTPPWADLDKIKDIYDKCPKGYHVDHIIPLQGEFISGLHIETNLQYLPALDNIKKGNKYTPIA